MMPNTNITETCVKCNTPTSDGVYHPYGEWRTFSPHHIACLDNADKPEEHRVCDECHKTGKDLTGNYPDAYLQYQIVHPYCIDWDNVRKYGR